MSNHEDPQRSESMEQSDETNPEVGLDEATIEQLARVGEQLDGLVSKRLRARGVARFDWAVLGRYVGYAVGAAAVYIGGLTLAFYVFGAPIDKLLGSTGSFGDSFGAFTAVFSAVSGLLVAFALMQQVSEFQYQRLALLAQSLDLKQQRAELEGVKLETQQQRKVLELTRLYSSVAMVGFRLGSEGRNRWKLLVHSLSGTPVLELIIVVRARFVEGTPSKRGMRALPFLEATGKEVEVYDLSPYITTYAAPNNELGESTDLQAIDIHFEWRSPSGGTHTSTVSIDIDQPPGQFHLRRIIYPGSLGTEPVILQTPVESENGEEVSPPESQSVDEYFDDHLRRQHEWRAGFDAAGDGPRFRKG